MQRRVRADGHVCAAEVVVDGSDHSDNVEVGALGLGRLVDLALLQEFIQEARPLLPGEWECHKCAIELSDGKED